MGENARYMAWLGHKLTSPEGWEIVYTQFKRDWEWELNRVEVVLDVAKTKAYLAEHPLTVPDGSDWLVEVVESWKKELRDAGCEIPAWNPDEYEVIPLADLKELVKARATGPYDLANALLELADTIPEGMDRLVSNRVIYRRKDPQIS